MACVTTRCHMSSGTGPYRPVQEGSGTATHPMAPDLTSPLGRAPTSPHVPELRTPHSRSGWVRCRHVSHGSGTRLPTREGFGVATCPIASYQG
jgi:hypothetical protein